MNGRPDCSVSIPLSCQFPMRSHPRLLHGSVPAAERQIVRRVDHAGVPDIERSPAVIRLGLQRIGGERGRVRRDAGVHAVAIVERLRVRVDAAELQTVAEPVVHIHFSPL